MATALIQGIGAATALYSANSNKFHFSSRRSISKRKESIFVVRSDGRVSTGLNQGVDRAGKLITNAVATKADNAAASTSSKPG